MYWLISRGACRENCPRPKGTHVVGALLSPSLGSVCLWLAPLSTKAIFIGWAVWLLAVPDMHMLLPWQTPGKETTFQLTLVEKSGVASDWLGLGNLSISKPNSMARREGTLASPGSHVLSLWSTVINSPT